MEQKSSRNISMKLSWSCKCFNAVTSISVSEASAERRQKKCTHDEMFSELTQSTQTERAQQNVWRQTMAESKKAQNEREDRRDVREDKWWEQQEWWRDQEERFWFCI
nr:golgin subfamily A member 6-like protein 22 [Caretta caretta]